jgi:photosystem II stability/assembly factor-like uncharacterized protein
MKPLLCSIRSKAAAPAVRLLFEAVIIGIAIPGFAAPPLRSEASLERPHQVTLWTPLSHIPSPLVQPGPLLSTTTWTPIGPAPLQSVNVVSGRVVGIAPDPTQAGTLYLAAAGGGVWKSIDGGGAWKPLTDPKKTLSMGAIAIGPSKVLFTPRVIYAGTGEANNSGDSNYGLGILISTNQGATWTLAKGPSDAFNRLTTSQIAVNPFQGSVAYAAMADFGNNGIFGANTGIWKTTDTGVTWTNTTASITSSVSWSAVVLDPNTPTIIYAAVGDIFGSTANGVYKSLDGGNTWTRLSGAPGGTLAGRIAIAISPSNPQVLYVTATGTGAAGSSSFGTLYKIMRSDDGGFTYTDLTSGTPNYMGSQGWYDTAVAVDPSNSAIVYVAGSAGTNSILRSTNSGVNWTDISSGGSTPHVDHHALVFNANGALLDGDDGGIFRLDSFSPISWTDLNGNLETIQFEGIGLHPTNPNIAIGGSQDNGTEVYSGGVVWTETDGGDGGFAKFSSTNGNRAYHQIPVASFGSNFFRRSDDGGITWITRTAGIVADINHQNFYAPFVVDPGNGDRVLYGTYNVWETTNGGNTWTALSTVGVNGWNPSGFNVDAIGLAPSTVNTIYASANGHIFRTINHGATWTEMSILGNPHVQDLQVNKTNSQIVYAVINTFNAGGTVFATTTGGALWSSISGNLPNEPAWSLQIGSVPGMLYVGADDGVYATINAGGAWKRFGTKFPHAQVLQLELSSSLHILGAGTHGRGMWEITAQ